jgi:transcription elongation factor GreA
MVPGLYLRLLHRHCSGRWQSQLLPADEIENRSVWNKCEEDAKMREQLTESDVKKIQEEIDYRKLVVRKEAIEAVKEARAHGDLSENFEYHAAKKDKNSNESRIRYLERMLKNANVITDHSKADEVGINKTVQVYFEEDDETETYRLVTSIRGNSLHNLISIESPLGKALMGHRVGDRIYIKVNDQYGYYVEIRSIENTQDESEDQIRKF